MIGTQIKADFQDAIKSNPPYYPFSPRITSPPFGKGRPGGISRRAASNQETVTMLIIS
jgi:hypothetical protein